MSDSQTLPLFKKLLNDKHPSLRQADGSPCKSNQSSLYSSLFKEEFDALDALEDVLALKRILLSPALHLSDKYIVQNSSVVHVTQAAANMKYLDHRHKLLQSFQGKLCYHGSEIKQHIAENIAGSGLSYEDLKTLYCRFGVKGLVGVLSSYLDGAFCLPCAFFAKHCGRNSAKLDKLVKSPLTFWTTAFQRLTSHSNGKCSTHNFSVIAMNNFIRTMKREAVPIDQQLNSLLQQQIAKNRTIMSSLFKTVLFCGPNNIAL